MIVVIDNLTWQTYLISEGRRITTVVVRLELINNRIVIICEIMHRIVSAIIKLIPVDQIIWWNEKNVTKLLMLHDDYDFCLRKKDH